MARRWQAKGSTSVINSTKEKTDTGRGARNLNLTNSKENAYMDKQRQKRIE